MLFSRVICCPRFSSRGFAVSWLLVGGLVIGCGGGGVREGTATTPNSDTRVSLVLTATIGCSDCGTDAQITPTVIALLADGRLAELDRFEPFVRVFAPDGAPEASFGVSGEGPGELGTNFGGGISVPGVYLFPWPAGELTILEAMPAVFETFAADGTFLRQTPLELPFATPGAQAFAPSSGSYFRHAYMPVLDQPNVLERCVLDLGGGSACGQITTATALTGIEPEGARADLSIATTPEGDLVVADATTYRFWVLNGDGTLVREFDRDIPPAPKSEEQLDAEDEANRQRLARGGKVRAIDPNRPYIAPYGVQVDGAGRIWVLTQRYTPGTWVFDVLDADGTFLNEVSIDALTRPDGYQITPFIVAGDRLAAISNQPDGSAHIDVYRIVSR